MCCDSGGAAPQVDPRQIDALLRQTDIAEKMANYSIDSDKRNTSRLEALDKRQQGMEDEYMSNWRKANSRADEQYDYYMSRGRPALDKMFKDANDYDSADTLSKLRGQAYTDVNNQFDAATGATTRNMQRVGIDPTNGRFAAAVGDLNAQRAVAKVAAANALTEGRKAGAIGLRQQSANVANGFPSTSMGFSGVGGAAASGAAGIGQSGFSNGLGLTSSTTGTMQAAGNMFGGVANGYNQVFQGQLSAYNSQNQASAGSAAGLGGFLGSIGGAAIKTFGPALMASDRRLKTNIERVGTTEAGLPLYRFNYIWSDKPEIGVMADEVEQVFPDAVITNADGYKMVDYSKVR